MHPIIPALVLTAVVCGSASCTRAPAPHLERASEAPLTAPRAAERSPAPHADADAPVPWREVGEVGGIPPHRVLRHPSLVVFGGELVYAGSTLFPDSGMRRGEFEVRTLAGRSLGRPAGSFRFASARAVVHESTGTLHLVWGESDSSATLPNGWPARITALWHSAFAGGAWSEPAKILAARSIGWGSQGGPLAVDRRGCVHVVVPTFVDEQRGLHHVRGFCAPWRDTRIESRGTYGAVTTTDDAAVLVAAAGADPAAPGVRNIVRVLRSTDGTRWEQVARVQVGAAEDRPEQVWLEARSGRLHLAWVHSLEAGGSMLDDAGRTVDRVGSRFVHLVSRDGGTTWADTITSAVEREPIFLARFLAHRCGVVAVYEGVATEGAGMRTTTRWVDLQRRNAVPTPVLPGAAMSFEPAPVEQRDTLLVLLGILGGEGDTSVARLASRPACHGAAIH